jgi:hypothetical protein
MIFVIGGVTWEHRTEGATVERKIEMSFKANRYKSKKRSGKSSGKRACRGKVRFRSREHAVDSLVGFRYQAARNERNGIESRIPVRVYQCSEFDCHGGWHLTSKPEFKLETSSEKRSA